MLIYVIPLILLIVVLLVVKKRQDAQGSDKPKATAAKSKKTASSARTTPPKTRVVEEVAPKPQEAVPLSADLRKKIERLISEANFFAAEAQINQALKKDNRQHELYLLLLDIHIQQKDEFAISQLLNHIRSLGLDEILAQAEAKKAEFEAKQVQAEATAPASKTEAIHQETAPQEFAFTPPPVSNDQAFDQLQQEITPSKAIDQQPLEFNFTSSSPSIPTVSQPEPVETKAEEKLEFDFNSLQTNLQAEPEAKAEPATEIPSFDFESFNTQNPGTAQTTEIATPSITENHTSDVKLPNFDFSIENKPTEQTEEITAKNEEIAPLDFSFTLDSAAPAVEQHATTPELDLSSLAATEPAQATEVPADTIDLEFKLDTAPEKPASSAISFDIPSAPTASANQDDPLVQSFPELSEVDEIVLNLDLAQQYIQLGAYDAAREILAEKEVDYTPQQRTQVDQLLNQIAS
ncbi:hypothetical protein ABEF90_12975 [Acinetobacter thermotolerans]|uniref:hypothetical protein n=1 Tax=Acinetobacter thermotolerans TaxID=3151487 RepID=UPI00325C0ED1